MSEQRPDILIGRKLPEHALWEQLQRRAQPLGLEFCSAFFNNGMTYAKARKWLADYGIKISVNALQGFYNSLDMRLRFASLQSAQIAETAKNELPKDWEQAAKDRIAQLKFELSMMNLGESQKLQLLQLQQNEEGMKGNFALKKEALTLQRDKFQFDAAKAALAAVKELKTISASKLSDVEKIDSVRRALFGELPEESSKT